MTMYEILKEIETVKIKMKNHRSEWFGMLGTEWEKADWMKKRNRLNELLAMLARA